MPELPDITIYIEALERRVSGLPLKRIRLASPFLLRTAAPPIHACAEKKVVAFRRLGKRIAIGLEDELWLVVHLMIAGRLHWVEPDAKLSGKHRLAAFEPRCSPLATGRQNCSRSAAFQAAGRKDGRRGESFERVG